MAPLKQEQNQLYPWHCLKGAVIYNCLKHLYLLSSGHCDWDATLINKLIIVIIELYLDFKVERATKGKGLK